MYNSVVVLVVMVGLLQEGVAVLQLLMAMTGSVFLGELLMLLVAEQLVTTTF